MTLVALILTFRLENSLLVNSPRAEASGRAVTSLLKSESKGLGESYSQI